MSGGDEPQRVTPKMLSANVLPMLGVAPEIGRTFSADEDKPGGEAVVILSHGVWQARFGGRAVLGERVLLDGRAATIIGVLPVRLRLFQNADGRCPCSCNSSDRRFRAGRCSR